MTGNASHGAATWAREPDGTVFIFLDESYSPFVAFAGVVVEESDAQRLESGIDKNFRRMRAWHQLSGLDSFDDFRKRGFHASANPPEVRFAFVAYLAEVLNFKSMIVYSDRSERPDLSDKKRSIIVLDRLARDILRKYRDRPKLVFYFESAQAMDPFVERVVRRAARAVGKRRQVVDVRFGTKRNPDLLAIPDYVLHIFGKWRVSADELPLSLDVYDNRVRSLATIAGSISMAKLLDRHEVIRRTSL
ncbi:hypothetical protein [Nocardioides daeguensis]|uniref:DUF3800 domain-containing protein n=1 Tax=Nocardioides daeguensis TaxID=908359 RepID=A0ABP6VFC8_9ACTN|nr:hypothetical protein [Nocardioides daeguensis]MBV6726043.1 hypothetical protein [Nocardioides daeguensis]MCR1771886.1 hypothetical protein [Nocardioides daeguensis]